MKLFLLVATFIISSASLAQSIKNGFYTNPLFPHCSLHMASYPESNVILVKVSDSINGVLCEQKKEVVPFTCDGKNKCVNENGLATLYILSPELILHSTKSGKNTEYTFSAVQIPVADKFFVGTFNGWTFNFNLGRVPKCTLSNKVQKYCADLTLDDLNSEKVCEQGLQESPKFIPKRCQELGFKTCQIVSATSRPLFQERVRVVEGIDSDYDSFRTGCATDMVVRGVR